jgi:DNA-binding HxlR family transcriptional regulator
LIFCRGVLADGAADLEDDREQRTDAGEHHQACDEDVGFHGWILAPARARAQPVNPRVEGRVNRTATIRIAMRTMNPVHESTSCAVAACAEIIGAKWTALLVHDLSEGPRRFSQLEHSCAGISPRTLSERLRALEEEGLVERRSYAESPPRVEYELTDKGEALLPIIEEMRHFRARVPDARVAHSGSAQSFTSSTIVAADSAMSCTDAHSRTEWNCWPPV